MPTGYAIEPMRLADIPEVVEIERVCFSTPWPASAYKRELKNQSSTRYLIARHYVTEPPAAVPAAEADARKSSLITRMLPFLKGSEPELPAAGTANPNPVVGYGGLWLMLDEVHVTTLGVAPSYRGQGLGEYLLVGLIDVALAFKANWMTLEVRVSNKVAQKLYEKYTFKNSGVRRKYYTDNDEDAFIMWSDELTKLSFREKYKTQKTQLLAKMAARGQLAAPAGQLADVDPDLPLIVPDLNAVDLPADPATDEGTATDKTSSH